MGVLQTNADPYAQSGPASFQRSASGYGAPGMATSSYQGPTGGQGGGGGGASGYTNPYDSIGPQLQGLFSGAAGVQGIQGAPTIGNSYAGYLGQARSRIAADLAQSIGDINASELRGQATINQEPGQLDRIYGPAQAQMQGAVAQEQGQQKAAGLQSFQDASGGMTAGAGAQLAGQGGVAPIQAAAASSLADRKADVPLLSLGNAEMGMRARGAARMTSDQYQTQLDQQAAQLGSSRDLAQAQIQAQYGTSANDFLRNAYLQGQTLQGQSILGGAGAQAQYQLGTQSGQFGVQAAQAYRASSAYPFAGLAQQATPDVGANNALVQQAVKQIKPDGSNYADVIRQQQAAGHARTAARLAQMYGPQ